MFFALILYWMSFVLFLIFAVFAGGAVSFLVNMLSGNTSRSEKKSNLAGMLVFTALAILTYIAWSTYNEWAPTLIPS